MRGFNPTMVRLGLRPLRAKRAIVPRFNPTMVRLGPQEIGAAGGQELAFQSHYGAIRTPRNCVPNRIPAIVSIPLWCD